MGVSSSSSFPPCQEQDNGETTLAQHTRNCLLREPHSDEDRNAINDMLLCLRPCDSGAVGHFTATLADDSHINIDTTNADAGKIITEVDGVRRDTGPSNPYFNRITTLARALAWAETVASACRNMARERVRQYVVSQNTELDLSGMGLEILPILPAGLTRLDISHNELTTLPPLPAGLTRLDVSHNRLTTILPENLPAGLTELYVNVNQLTALPPLPDGLTRLNVGYNPLTTLPRLPDGLTRLDVYKNRLTALPPLPPGLTELDAGSNALTTLPPLPDGLTRLDVCKNLLTTLPCLPDGLTRLNADHNRLTTLPVNLPAGLTVLNVSNNPLTALPVNLPPGLTVLMDDSRLTALPDGLTELHVRGNDLRPTIRTASLPEVPDA